MLLSAQLLASLLKSHHVKQKWQTNLSVSLIIKYINSLTFSHRKLIENISSSLLKDWYHYLYLSTSEDCHIFKRHVNYNLLYLAASSAKVKKTDTKFVLNNSVGHLNFHKVQRSDTACKTSLHRTARRGATVHLLLRGGNQRRKQFIFLTRARRPGQIDVS